MTPIPCLICSSRPRHDGYLHCGQPECVAGVDALPDDVISEARHAECLAALQARELAGHGVRGGCVGVALEGIVMAQVEVYLIVDAQGDYAVGRDMTAAQEDYESAIQPMADCNGYRVVRLTVDVPTPAVVEVDVEVPADESAPSVTVSQS